MSCLSRKVCYLKWKTDVSMVKFSNIMCSELLDISSLSKVHIMLEKSEILHVGGQVVLLLNLSFCPKK